MTGPPAPKGRAADRADERRAQRGARREGGGPQRPGGAKLRSDAWLRGDDEVALANRVALASAGLDVSADGGRPVIGIAN